MKKNDDFKQYMDRAGTIDLITKMLVGLYQLNPQPANARDYVKRLLNSDTNIDVEKLQFEY